MEGLKKYKYSSGSQPEFNIYRWNYSSIGYRNHICPYILPFPLTIASTIYTVTALNDGNCTSMAGIE
jgi:hypothetical protein